VRPYIGGGLSVINADFERSAGMSDDDDTSPGVYFHAGADWYITDKFFLGLAYRLLTATDIDVFGESSDADYEQFALRAGFSF
jgi:opacity protein-like surface antigen